MAIARVQFREGGNDASGTSIATAAMSVTIGNWIVVIVRGYEGGNNQDITTLVDTAGNTYTFRAEYRGADPYMWSYTAPVTTAHATNVVTATFDITISFRWIVAIEYSGITSFDLAGVNNAALGGSDLVSTAITTAQDEEVLVMGGSQAAFTTFTAGADFTLIDGALGGANTYGGIEERITTSDLSSYTAHLTSDTSGANWSTAWIALKGAADVPPVTPPIAWITA